MDFYIFLICLFCGVVSGTVYDVLYAARIFVCGTDKGEYTVKDRIFIIICDTLYCLLIHKQYFALYEARFLEHLECFLRLAHWYFFENKSRVEF